MRCQPIKIAGLMTRRADLQAKKDQRTTQSLAAFVSRRGGIWRSWSSAKILRRNSFSALNAVRDLVLERSRFGGSEASSARPRRMPIVDRISFKNLIHPMIHRTCRAIGAIARFEPPTTASSVLRAIFAESSGGKEAESHSTLPKGGNSNRCDKGNSELRLDVVFWE